MQIFDSAANLKEFCLILKLFRAHNYHAESYQYLVLLLLHSQRTLKSTALEHKCRSQYLPVSTFSSFSGILGLDMVNCGIRTRGLKTLICCDWYKSYSLLHGITPFLESQRWNMTFHMTRGTSIWEWFMIGLNGWPTWVKYLMRVNNLIYNTLPLIFNRSKIYRVWYFLSIKIILTFQ